MASNLQDVAPKRRAPAELTIDDVKEVHGERENGTVEKYWLLGLHDRIVDVSLATSGIAENVTWLERQLSTVAAGNATEETFGGIEGPLWSWLTSDARVLNAPPPGPGGRTARFE